jgi:RNA polymerase sigma factor (sigma-70 family)
VRVSERPQVESSFDELAGRLDKAGRVYLRRHRLPPEDADDILQQALLVFLCKRAEIQDPECWLRGTLRKRCQLYWRGRQRSLLTQVDRSVLEAMATRSPGQEDEDVSRDLGRALDRIPARCRRLLELRYREGRDPREAATQLGYQPSGVYKIMSRCLAALTRGLVATGFLTERVDEPS